MKMQRNGYFSGGELSSASSEGNWLRMRNLKRHNRRGDREAAQTPPTTWTSPTTTDQQQQQCQLQLPPPKLQLPRLGLQRHSQQLEQRLQDSLGNNFNQHQNFLQISGEAEVDCSWAVWPIRRVGSMLDKTRSNIGPKAKAQKIGLKQEKTQMMNHKTT